MSFFKRLWDTPDMISEGVDAVIRSGDALVYTDEEKAEFGQRVREWLLKWQEATSGQNLARRLIALAITFVWLLECLVALVLSVLAALNPENANLLGAAKVCQEMAADMLWVESAVLTFYFVPNKIGEAVVRARHAKQ